MVVSIWIKRFKGGPMDAVDWAAAVAARGLVGNADQRGRRQITLIDEALWREAQEELGAAIDPAARRANVMTRGIDLTDSRGRLLRIGECTLRIYNETRPCEQMDEAYHGLRAVLGKRWRGGVYGEVVEGGVLRVTDATEWIAAPKPAMR